MSQQDKNEKDYLKELAPNLFSKEMDAGHEVPEGYFESIENQVLSKIDRDSEYKPTGKIGSLINFRNLSIAAGLALLMALIPLLKDTNPAQTASIQSGLQSISEDAARLYLAEEYDLESIAADIAFESIDISDDEGLTEEEILNYLLDSEISESLLYESL
ncbi:MAG: hypothetical protein ACI8QH_000958 [Flammeovirgaceae bacterium]|jgi:hypothetical protein